MEPTWQQTAFAAIYSNTSLMITLLTVILHIICATAVAKDLGNMAKRSIAPQILPTAGWVLAALLGGIWATGIYWVMHHSSWAR